MSTGVFPNEPKTAIVKPLFKKSDPCDSSNYRPIALFYPYTQKY